MIPEIKLSLSPAKVELILRGLNELPRKISDELFVEINMEALKQVQANNKKEKEDAPST